jgi:cytochrome c oxidase assembly protein subunit 15
MSSKKASSLFISLVFLSLLLTLLTVGLSAYIRLAESGAGCKSWPQCYANIGTEQQQQGVAVLTKQGETMPHRGARLAHRYIASILGLFILGLVMVSMKPGSATREYIPLTLGLLGLTVFLSILGYSTPTRTAPLVTLGNLAGGMAMLGVLWWLGQRAVAESGPGSNIADSNNRRLALVGLVLLSLQIMSGAWVSANFAASACANLLECGNAIGFKQLIAGFDWQRQLTVGPDGRVVLDQATDTIAITHRIFALITAAYLGWLAIRLIRLNNMLRSTAITMAGLLLIQIGLGVASILAKLPLTIVTTHNLIAALLLLSSINLLHLSSPARESD